MRILLSAFAFAPHQGSEPGVGWRWAMELAREHEVVVITDQTRRALVEPELQANPQPSLRVIFHRPGWLRRMPLNASTAQHLYALWQFSLPGLVRSLHAQQPFDLAVHLTYGVFRHASFVGGLGIPFVFGPLGGGEDAPAALKRSIKGRERLNEALRAVANRLALVDPMLWWSLWRSDLVLVKTPQSRAALPWPFRRQAVVFPEIGIDAPEAQPLSQRMPGQPLRALFAGRLVGWKGAHLALLAVARARSRGLEVQLDIVGRGPFEPELRALHRQLNLGDAVRFINHMPQAQLFQMYRQAHVFLFPSLHDSSGNVVLEAQAFGCPVICLDLGGPATLVTEQTALVVKTHQCGEPQVIERLAEALMTMAQDEPARMVRAAAARAHASAMTWAGRVGQCLQLVKSRGLVP